MINFQVRSSSFEVRGCCRIDELGNCLIDCLGFRFRDSRLSSAQSDRFEVRGSEFDGLKGQIPRFIFKVWGRISFVLCLSLNNSRGNFRNQWNKKFGKAIF